MSLRRQRDTLLALAVVGWLASCLAVYKYIQDTDCWTKKRPCVMNELKEDSVGFGELEQGMWRGKVELISWKPRAFLLHNFLSEQECDHLIRLALENTLTKSTVVDPKTGELKPSRGRTSSGTALARHQDDVVARIEKRIAMTAMIPEENCEWLQVLRYVNGEKYAPHRDYFEDQYHLNPDNGGQRIATVLMYLTTPEFGGETVFPQAEPQVSGPGWSECALDSLAVRPKRGNALLFYSVKPNGDVEPASLHGSCPTLAGEKWSATCWIREGPYGDDMVL